MSVSSHQPQAAADQPARAAALDQHKSVLVQAPAGSGKTDLLTQRFLALLPTVAEPEQVLAITFTRKATAEMRARVVAALEAAAHGPQPEETPHQQHLRALAEAVLRHADTQGWQLLQQPQRLNIQTIDSLALSIAQQMPLLSRLGGQLSPVDDAKPLYALAAQRTLAHLGSAEAPDLAAALAEILRLRDASLPDCEALIANMLERRDQWLLLIPGIADRDPDWKSLFAELEAPFQREHAEVLAQLQEQMAHHLPELLRLARVACGNGAEHLAAVADLQSPEELIELAHWSCLCQMLLTKDSDWRKTVNKHDGFPATTHRAEGSQVVQLIKALDEEGDILPLLCRARSLPPNHYSDEERGSIRSIFTLLRRATAELRVVFAEQGKIDFAEAGIGAHAALRDPAVLMRQDSRIQHLLVDEFQDTSRTQLALLRQLLQDWQPGDGRTCFFVGDPMQSIYLFRAAEASLFGHIREHGLELENARIPVAPLTLETNFRSTAAIVDPINQIFERVLLDEDADGVAYAPSCAYAPPDAGRGDAVGVHVQVISRQEPDSRQRARDAQADEVLRVIHEHLPLVEEARRTGASYRIAILVRSRSHLPAILSRLQQQGIPFRGVKIEPLQERPEVLDLLSLLQALLHPADRIAWLSVLRAPWCGLPLPALHAICGDPDGAALRATIPELLRANASRLQPQERERALRTLATLEQAAAAYAGGLLSTTPAALSLWLERTWHALGAPLYLDTESLANAEIFFATLAQVPVSSTGTLDASFNRRLRELFAEPDPATSDRYGVQIMTIHAAKGLEFEAVLLPALERIGRGDDHALFRWLVRRRPHSHEDELLLAPIGRKQDDTPAMYTWVGKKAAQRVRQEHKRLLYVASSRAIRALHLFAAVEQDDAGAVKAPAQGTLLAAGWDGLQSRVEAAARALLPASKIVTMPAPVPPPCYEAGVVSSLAASAPGQVLHRLPQSWFAATDSPSTTEAASPAKQSRSMQDRLARVRGVVLHTLLEHAATDASLTSRPADDPQWARVTTALLRQHALGSADLASLREEILKALRNTLTHPHGAWLLQNTSAALTEVSWSSVHAGRLQRQRPDRVFLGGDAPGLPGDTCVWIVDYKTAALEFAEDAGSFLSQSRELYRGQLEQYSRLLRASNEGQTERPHRLALYHPMLPHLDWWPAE